MQRKDSSGDIAVAFAERMPYLSQPRYLRRLVSELVGTAGTTMPTVRDGLLN
jgi:hypothetical protein